jgi:probable rRNA maturation factor
MCSEIKVEISDTQVHLRVDHPALARLVRTVLAAENRRHSSISIALVDDTTIHTLNRAHLGHDWPTDVISFPLSTPEAPLAGELVVSAEMACAMARELDVEPFAELSLYVIHGLLHLCGFDDHNDADINRMRQREDELLALNGLTHANDQTAPGDKPSNRESLLGPKGGASTFHSPTTHQSESGPWTG